MSQSLNKKWNIGNDDVRIIDLLETSFNIKIKDVKLALRIFYC